MTFEYYLDVPTLMSFLAPTLGQPRYALPLSSLGDQVEGSTTHVSARQSGISTSLHKILSFCAAETSLTLIDGSI